MTGRAKTFWTILITGSIAVLLPIVLVKIVRASMGRLITDDNAGIVFTQFQEAINEGAVIHDPITAAAAANEAYEKKTHGILVDGWAKRMNVFAAVEGNSCQLNIQSAGPDGNFGTKDDVTIEQTFDISPVKKPATQIAPDLKEPRTK
jgi:hypothetical protein